MVRVAFSFTHWAIRLGRMLDFIARNGPTNYYAIKEGLKRKGYGGGTMQRDLQLLTRTGFLHTQTPRTHKRNRKKDYDLTVNGMMLFIGITSHIDSLQSRNYIDRLIHKYPTYLPRIAHNYEDIEKLKLNTLAASILQKIAREFYDRATISNLHLNPSDPKEPLDTHLIEHLFFTTMAPPSLFLRTSRAKLEEALQNPSGAAIRNEVIKELEHERKYYSTYVEVIDEKIKFLNRDAS